MNHPEPALTLVDLLSQAFAGLYEGLVPFVRLEALIDRLEGAK